MATEDRAEDLGSFEDIKAAAVRTTGLDDFGGTAHEEGLRILCEDLVEHGGLTPEGNYMQRAHGEERAGRSAALRARLQGAPVVRRRADRATDLRLRPPPHRHHRAAPAAQRRPRPPGARAVAHRGPPAATSARDLGRQPDLRRPNAAFSEHQVENPEFMGIHFMDAGTVEECWRILRQAGKSIGFESLAYVPAYSAWLEQQDWTDAYERHRANLQLIGLNDPEKRWVLKNPSHLVGLDAIMSVYPDALIVQTHRDPVVAIASACSLSAEATKGWSTTFVGDTIGRTQLDMLSKAVGGSSASARTRRRAVHRPRLPEFVADPWRPRRHLRAVGLEWTPRSTRRSPARRESRRAGGARHNYDLADYGLTEDEVRAALSE